MVVFLAQVCARLSVSNACIVAKRYVLPENYSNMQDRHCAPYSACLKQSCRLRINAKLCFSQLSKTVNYNGKAG